MAHSADKREKILATDQLNKLLREASGISWEVVRLLGEISDSKRSKNPVHTELVEAMKSGKLQTMFTEAGMDDPKLALKVASKVAAKGSDLLELIGKTFEATGLKAEWQQAKKLKPVFSAKDESLTFIQLLTSNAVTVRQAEPTASKAQFAVATPMADSAMQEQTRPAAKQVEHSF